MTITKIWYLEKFDFTKKLCKDEVIHMEKSMVMRKVAKDTVLHFPEMKEKFVYFLKDGLIKIVHYSEDGREAIKYLISPGNIFGELALLENSENNNDYAVAVNDCTICFMNVEVVSTMMQQNNELTIHIRKLIGLRLKKLETRLESLLFKDSRTRIIEFLLELGKEFGTELNGKVVVKNFLTHDEIAKLTASSRQTVTMLLNELRTKGQLTYSTKLIEFTTTKLVG